MPKIDTQKLIFDIDGVPPREDKSGLNNFWRDIESDNVRSAAIFCILNELRNINPKEVSGKECRTVLARCQAHLSFLDLPSVLENWMARQEEEEELESPFDAEFNDNE